MPVTKCCGGILTHKTSSCKKSSSSCCWRNISVISSHFSLLLPHKMLWNWGTRAWSSIQLYRRIRPYVASIFLIEKFDYLFCIFGRQAMRQEQSLCLWNRYGAALFRIQVHEFKKSSARGKFFNRTSLVTSPSWILNCGYFSCIFYFVCIQLFFLALYLFYCEMHFYQCALQPRFTFLEYCVLFICICRAFVCVRAILPVFLSLPNYSLVL